MSLYVPRIPAFKFAGIRDLSYMKCHGLCRASSCPMNPQVSAVTAVARETPFAHQCNAGAA
eukprot:1554068-Rhodomonas_salina.1